MQKESINGQIILKIWKIGKIYRNLKNSKKNN
jgi:hypothetical protein